MDYAIETERLTRMFGRRTAIEELTLKIPVGSVFALLGRNGSGKSTTIRMLLGLLRPTRGTSKVMGHDSQKLPGQVRNLIGYVPEGHPVYRFMRPRDCERLQKAHFPRFNASLFRTIVDAFRIEKTTLVRDLSRGQRAGLSLAMAMATRPDLLVLDDPSLGLDPVAQRALLDTLAWFTSGGSRTVLITSHTLTDVEKVASWVAVVDQSVLRVSAPVDVFRSRIRQYLLRFTAEPPRLPALRGQLTVAITGHECRVTVANPSDETRALLLAMNPTSFEELTLSLADALLAYLGKGASTKLHFPDWDDRS